MGAQTGNGSALDHSTTRLSAGLEQSLSAYATAATAAGLSLLALASPADARIVYTPANTPIPLNGGPVPLDLNHDGIVDFSFSNRVSSTNHEVIFLLLGAPNGKSNAMWGRGSFGNSFFNFSGAFAAALHSGFAVRPNRSYFQRGKNGILGFYQGAVSSGSFTTQTYGQWLNTRRYLGVQFLIDGQVHYGWARFSVTTIEATHAERGIKANLTGYAYETIPNKPIITGKTKGPDVITLEPATLGRLAQGASGIPAWREKK